MSDLHAALALLISGAIVMGYGVAGLFFLRFWRETRDRLFLIFAGAFWLLGLQRLALAFSRNMVEDDTTLYLVRLFAFLLILGAIVDKNRASPLLSRLADYRSDHRRGGAPRPSCSGWPRGPARCRRGRAGAAESWGTPACSCAPPGQAADPPA